MKKNLISIILFISIITVIITAYGGKADKEGVFRLHIIANSNSREDQQVKLLVRDAVLKLEKERLADSASKAQARETIMLDAGKVLDEINFVLKENGKNYSARMAVGNYNFPQREYDGYIYPADKYDALRIVLGDGNGENWWCLMYPPLCIMDTDDEQTDDIEFRSLLVEWFGGEEVIALWEKMVKSMSR